ncbi:MAG: response regulator transcription factor [Oscillospiraceae bacterium]
MTKVFCVEDDESIRELILLALKGDGYQPKGFESGAEFFKELQNNIPDLVLLDIMLPSDDGFVILKKLREYPATKNVSVIMLTAKSTEYDKVKGLDLGADDYITKPFGVMELLSRARAVLRRAGKVTNDSVITVADVTVDSEKRTVTVGANPCTLTYKEFELLYYLIKNNSIVLSRNKLLETIWGFDFEGESRTVDMHIKTLRQKLAECGAKDVIKTVRSVGYKFEG